MRPLIFTAVALSGCAVEDARISRCEDAAKAAIKAPATYQRFSADIDREVVVITFDSQNGFGATLRSLVSCVYATDGKLDLVLLNNQRVPKEISGSNY